MKTPWKKLFLKTPESQDELEVYVLEQAYQWKDLSSCDQGGDYVASVLKEILVENDELIYAMVEDDVELNAISKVFAEMLEDVDIEC